MFLLAQGIELAIKSWMLQGGATAEQLKDDYAHRLAQLLKSAGGAGFPYAGAAELYLVEGLEVVYAGAKLLQYPRPEAIAWPSPLAVRELLRDALCAACAIIYPQIDTAGQWVSEDRYWSGLRIEPGARYAGRSLSLMRLGALPQASPLGHRRNVAKHAPATNSFGESERPHFRGFFRRAARRPLARTVKSSPAAQKAHVTPMEARP
jgi:hypothetical protein